MLRKLRNILLYVMDSVIPKNTRQIVFSSYPDFSDNSFALFRYISMKKMDFKIIWLVDEIDKKDLFTELSESYSIEKNYTIVSKGSLKGIYYYLTSRYAFFTHGLFNGVRIPKSRVVVNLWHGMPLKSIGFLIENYPKEDVPKCTYSIATSSLYQRVVCDAFALTKEQVILSGLPRNDLLFCQGYGELSKLGIQQNYSKTVMWMPTYRKSIVGEIREDGTDSGFLPLFEKNEMSCLNEHLIKANTLLLIKLHPMDSLNSLKLDRYSNILFLKKDCLLKNSVQLYSLLSEVDALITDYSSVYIDFLLTKKPIAFIVEDIASYSNSRGMVFDEPLNYMPGDLIRTVNEFYAFIDSMNRGDKYLEVLSELHSNFFGASERIVSKLELDEV